MKVLHILNELQPSGAETMLKVSAPFFSACGIEAEILATGEKLGNFSHDLKSVDYKVHHIALSKKDISYFKLFIFLRRQKYDRLHVHTEGKRFLVCLTAYCAGNHKIISTVHNVFLYQGSILKLQKLQRRILRWLGIIYVTISNSVEKNELELLNNPSVRIDNWYDSNTFSPSSNNVKLSLRKQMGIRDDVTVITSVGNCSEIKNHQLLIQALALFDKLIPDWIYLHLGKGTCETDEILLSQQLGIGEKCRFVGAQKNVKDYLIVSDIYVMPSLKEGFSISLLEALACGVPTILAKSPGLLDIKQFAPNVLFSELSADDLSANLKRLVGFENYEEASQKALITAQVIRDNFSISNGTSKYVEIYNSI